MSSPPVKDNRTQVLLLEADRWEHVNDWAVVAFRMLITVHVQVLARDFSWVVITNTVQTVAGDIVVSNKSLSTCPPASDEELLMEMRVRSEELGAPGARRGAEYCYYSCHWPESNQWWNFGRTGAPQAGHTTVTAHTLHHTQHSLTCDGTSQVSQTRYWYVIRRLTTTSAPQLSEFAEFTVKLSLCSIVPERIKYHEIQFFHQRSSYSYANVPLTGTGVNCNLLNRIVINLLFSPWEIIKIST